jgi:hypothetical protein
VVVTFLLVVATGLTHAQGPAPLGAVDAEAALGTAFTYQGRLVDAEGPVNGTCSLWFSLYDAAGSAGPPSGGARLGTVETRAMTISDGTFAVQLDFGSGVFTGDARWLEIIVDCWEGRVALSPRQELTPAPYALYAPSAGTVPWSGLNDVPTGLGDGDDDTLAELSPSCTHGQIAEWNEEAQEWECSDDDTTYGTGAGLNLAGTTFTADFAGTGSASTVARSDHQHDATYVNDDGGEVGDGDVPVGALSPDRISGTPWTGANDGAGSGLNADRLDGQLASAFANASHDHLGQTWTGSDNPLKIEGSLATRTMHRWC